MQSGSAKAQQNDHRTFNQNNNATLNAMGDIEQAIRVGSSLLTPGSDIHIGDIHIENAGGASTSPPEPHDFTDIRNAKSDTQSTTSSSYDETPPQGDGINDDSSRKSSGSPETFDSATTSDDSSPIDSNSNASRRDKGKGVSSSAADRKNITELSETATRRRRKCLLILSFLPFMAASIALGLYVLRSRSPSNVEQTSNEGDNMGTTDTTSDDAFFFQPPTNNRIPNDVLPATIASTTTSATTSVDDTPKSQLVLEEDPTTIEHTGEAIDDEQSLLYSLSSTGETEVSHGNLRATTSPTMSPTPNNNITKSAFTYPELVNVGNDGEPTDVYPLQLCQGDCDKDEDCEGSLTCVQRDALEVIPGCSGLGSYGVDYCANLDTVDENVDTSMYVPLLASVGNDGEPKEAFPLQLCQGDCDTNEECVGSLICFKRDGNDPVPGCSGLGIFGSDYCTSVEAIEGTRPTSSDTGGESDSNNAELSSQHGNLLLTSSPIQAPTCIADSKACPADEKQCCSEMCSKNKETGDKVCGEWIREDNAVVQTDICVPSGEECPADKKDCCEGFCSRNEETGERVCGTWTAPTPWDEAETAIQPFEETCTKPGEDCLDKKLCCSQKCTKYENYMKKVLEATGEKIEEAAEEGNKDNQKREVCE